MEATRTRALNKPWVARLAVKDASAASVLRLRDDIRGAIVDGSLWLRGDRLDEELDAIIASIAPDGYFELAAGDQLVPPGHRLPTALLPTTQWESISHFFPITWPLANRPAMPQASAELCLVRSEHEAPANAILVENDVFRRWADTASAVRLFNLRFAATADHSLVMGLPLPPLPGVRHYESDGIVVPCGWSISPPIDPPSLRVLLVLHHDDVALFTVDGWQRIAADYWVQATRSAVRLTHPREGNGL